MPRVPSRQRQEFLQQDRIPRADRPQRDSGETGVQVAQAIGSLGQATTTAGIVTSDIAGRVIVNQDIAAAQRGMLKAEEEIDRLLEQTFAQEGENAFGTAESVDEKLTALKDSLTQDMSPGAANRFSRFFDKSRLRASSAAFRHERLQREQVRDTTSQALIQTEVKNIVDFKEDPAAVELGFARLQSHIVQDARNRGLSSEVRDAQLAEKFNEAHVKVIESWIADENPAVAKEWFDQHKDELDPVIREQLEARIERSVGAKTAQDKADILLAKHPPTSWGLVGQQEAAALAEARSSAEGAERDELVRRVKAQYADARRLLQEQKQVQLETVTEAILNTSSEREARALADKLFGSDQAQAERMIAARFAPAPRGKPVPSDYQTFRRLQDAFDLGQPVVIEADGNEMSVTMSDTSSALMVASALGMHPDLLNDWNDYVNGNGVRGAFPADTILSEYKSLGIEPKDPQEAKNLLDATYNRLAGLGRNPTKEDLVTVATALTTRIVEDGFVFTTSLEEAVLEGRDVGVNPIEFGTVVLTEDESNEAEKRLEVLLPREEIERLRNSTIRIGDEEVNALEFEKSRLMQADIEGVAGTRERIRVRSTILRRLERRRQNALRIQQMRQREREREQTERPPSRSRVLSTTARERLPQQVSTDPLQQISALSDIVRTQEPVEPTDDAVEQFRSLFSPEAINERIRARARRRGEEGEVLGIDVPTPAEGSVVAPAVIPEQEGA